MGLFYSIPAPNEALIIAGGLGSKNQEKRIITGRGTLHIPFIHKVFRFYIGAHTVRIRIKAQTAQSIDLNVEATVVFRVSNNPGSISEAASRFLSADVDEMEHMASDIFSGSARTIVGKMSVEEIIADRDKLNLEVLESTAPKMSQLGLQIDNFQINQISDDNNHIRNLSMPELANVRRRAEIAEAEASSKIEEAVQQAARDKSLYKKDTDLQVSANTIETSARRAEAEQSAPLAEAIAKVKVAEQEEELVRAQGEVEKARLQVDIVTKAEAEAQATIIKAEAEAKATAIKAEAIAANNGIILTQEIINNMPEIVKAYGESIANSNLTVFNGSEGITQMFTEAMTMGASVINTVKDKTLETMGESDYSPQIVPNPNNK